MSREAMQMALEALESDPISHAGLVSRKQAITALRQALVDADDTSQERVDETAKREHEPWQSVQCTCGGTIYFKHTKREWVGLDGEIPGLGLVTEEFYNGMLFAEDILRGKNGG